MSQIFEPDGSVSYQEPTPPTFTVTESGGIITITKPGHGLVTGDAAELDTTGDSVRALGLVIVDVDTVTVTNSIAADTILDILKLDESFTQIQIDASLSGDAIAEIDSPAGYAGYEFLLDGSLVSCGEALGCYQADDNVIYRIDDGTAPFDPSTPKDITPIYFCGGPNTGGSTAGRPPTPVVPINAAADVPSSSSGISVVFNMTNVEVRAAGNQWAELRAFLRIIRGAPDAEWNAQVARNMAEIIAENLRIAETQTQAFTNLQMFTGIGSRPEDLLVITPGAGTAGTPGVTIIRSTEPLALVYRNNALARGCTVITVADARAAMAAIPGRLTTAQILNLGLTARVGTPAPVAGALGTRWGGAIRTVGGTFLSAGIQAGFLAIDYLGTQPLGMVYRQGRLQLRNILTSDGRQIDTIGSKIFYTPLNIDNPGRAQITIRHPTYTDRNNSTFQYRIADMNGNVPSLDLTQDNPFPTCTWQPTAKDRNFGVGDGISNIRWDNLGDHHKSVIPGRPMDIFIAVPEVHPAGGLPPAGDNPSFFDLYFEGYSLLNPPNPANEAVLARAANQIPRLFWLNWRGLNQRRIGGVGHYLVWHENAGLCLGTPWGSADDPADTRCPDGLPGYFNNIGSLIGPSKYVYLGTLVPGPGTQPDTVIGAVPPLAVNMPGCRMLWNMYNKLPYDDFRLENQKFLNINRGRISGLAADRMQLDPFVPDIWHHQYANPTGQTGNPWYFSHPRNGRLKIGNCGPIGVSVVHKQYDSPILDYYDMANATPRQYGNVDCSYKEIAYTNMSRPVEGDLEMKAGFNDIEVRSHINASQPPLRKQYCFIGPTKYLYEPNFGALCADDDTDAWIVREVVPDAIEDEAADATGRGWGMQGEC